MKPALFYRRLVHALDNLTFRELAAKTFRRLRGKETPVTRPLPASAPHPFDQAHNVDTGGFQSGDTLAPGAYHTAYYGIAPSGLAQALDHLGSAGLDWTQFTFVDLGAGKGRALLVASRHPFQSILGVELSPELCAVARANLESFSASWQRCRNIEIVRGDAATLAFPETPLVVFLYHPFLAPMLRRVLRNLERSVRQVPREVFLLYANPSYEKVLARFAFLKLQWHYSLALSEGDAAADLMGIVNDRYALYRHTPPS